MSLLGGPPGGRGRAALAGPGPALLALLGLAVLTPLLGDLLGRALGLGALGPGPRTAVGQPRVALTFDDGPSPRTPELLAALREGGAGGTFFVLEEACAAYPAEFALLRQSGGQIESHGRWHRHALTLTPVREAAQLAWTPPGGGRLYRPPYGGHSPLTRWHAARAGKQVALWDAEGRDWLDLPARELAQAALRQLRPGSVLLLHDGPAVTPELLRHLLPALAARGWEAVRLDDLPPEPLGWREAWRRLGRSYGLGG